MYDVTRRVRCFAAAAKFLVFATLGAPLFVEAADPNDQFVNAIPLIGPIVTTTGNNTGATKQFGGEPSIGPGLGLFGGASLWWTWTATASGPTTIDTEGSDFNTLLGVFTGAVVNQQVLVAGNDNYGANLWSRVEFDAVAGTRYNIMVDGFRSGPGFGAPAQGNIVLHVKGVGGLEVVTPTNGTVTTVGEDIPFLVTTDANFPNPPATRIDFYRAGVLFGSDSEPPFTAVATDVPPGTNAFYVVAIDSLGNPVQSGIINVFVQSIGVTMLTPFDGTTYLNTNPITATAWGYLPSGSITRVDFFVNGQKFGEDDTAPFSATWSNVVSGSHRLTAVGVSDVGTTYNSQPMNIAVAQLLLASNSVWKYLDNGSDQGTAWYAKDFDDSSWQSGPAPLGYSDSNGRQPATTNSFGPSETSKYITTYYRQSFTAGPLSGYTNVTLNIQRDDGAVVYLNGAELARLNMPTGEVTFATFASSNAGDDGGTTFSINVNPGLLVEGNNVLAVEIHQDSPNSSDIWFTLDLLGIPPIIRNLSPVVVMNNPTNSQYFLGPASITMEVEATDADGTVEKVEFFADGVKLGEDTTSPYAFVWNNPPLGPHELTAMATDDQDGTQVSSPITVVVYDATGTPFGRVTRPLDGAEIEGGTNVLVTAYANAPSGVSKVEFLSDGVVIGSDESEPYSLVWDAPFGTHALTVRVTDNVGGVGTSATVSINVFPNTIAPTVANQTPAGGATVTYLTNITVNFSEPVQNVHAGDLLVNGVPATSVTGSGTRYVFGFVEPPYGPVAITWAAGHGITDFGFPADLPFDGNGAGATWNYTLIDRTAPVIAARTPVPGSTVTELQQLTVTFSESVSGVDAADLLVGGTPAFSLSGGGNTYTFLVSQPNSGTVNVTWATNSGIFDLSDVPNAFVGTNAGWSFNLDTRTVLMQSNSVWRYFKGVGEPSAVTGAWRQPAFETSVEWLDGAAPFFFGDPYTNAVFSGTHLSDMLSNYTTIYLRTEFVVTNRASITNLFLNHQSDDGFVAWLNGVQVLRYNAPIGEVPYNGVATTQAQEPNNAGAAYIGAALVGGHTNLINGTNILAIQAFNQSLTSSDFGFNAQLYSFIPDLTKVSPRLLTPSPAPGDLLYLTNITVTFTEPVSGVNASDLLINGVPAASLASASDKVYTFSFPQPAYGAVAVTWAADHGISDFDTPPKPFIGTSAGFNYTLFNPINPRVASQVPAAGTLITGLTSVAVTFTKPVTGVEAEDFLVNGTPAVSVTSADQTTYRFTVTQPAYGTVSIRWATNHGIVDLESPPNAFDPTRFGGQWNYTLVNPVPSVVITSPANNANVLAPTVTIRANATDADGTIARVEFFENTAGKLGEATASPYTYVWDNVVQGPYTLRAIATDNTGLRATSAPVVINVVTSLPIVLVRGPYLQIGTPTSGTVRWRSDLFSDAVVFYGTDPGQMTNVIVRTSLTNEHIIPINGLEPDTKYYYSVGNSAQRLAEGTNFWFTTSPVPGTRKPTRIWVLGDAGTAGNGSPDRQASTRDAFYRFAETNNRPADLWLMLGDNAYNSGTDAEHQAAVFNMYPNTLRNLFLWPTIGNHETSQSTTATDFPYLDIFSLPRNGEAGGVPSGTEKYYSFDYGNIHFVCLDSMTSGRTASTPMADWLRNDLESTSQEWIIVFFHHPPYTKGSHDSDAEGDLVEIRQNLVPILEEHGVDLVLSGHSHCYERSYLLDKHYGMSGTITASNKVDGGNGRLDGTGGYTKNVEGRGTVYSVAGSSGQATGGQLNMPGHFISLNELGSVVIDVASNRLDMIFINAAGERRDYFTLLKPTPPPAPETLIARALGDSEIALSWTDAAANELGYILERSLDGVDFTRFATNAVDSTNAVDTGLAANTTYYYRVITFNDRGDSEPSVVASATTIFTTSAPNAPTQLVVQADDGTDAYRSQMIVRWVDQSSNESGFLLERSDDGYEFHPVTTVAANVTSYVDRQLSGATLYFYRVRSFNPVAESAFSNLDGNQTHPQDDIVMAGESTFFRAGVEGVAPIRYQWSFNGTPIPGGTNETLWVNNVQAGNEGGYSVRVTDANGPINTPPAWLFVLQPPYIVNHPANSTNIVGSTLVLEVTAGGTGPFTYQWRKDGVHVPGALGAQFVHAPATLADAGEYDVVVTSDYGAVTSQVARVIMSDNRYPSLAAIPDYTIDVLQTLTITNLATDPDVTNHLTFTLVSSPTNATLNSTSGVFRWTPDRSQAPSTNLVTVRVNDNGFPNLSDTRSFIVTVNDYVEITLGTVVALTGQSNSIPVEVFSSAPLVDLEILLELPTERFEGLALSSLLPELLEASLVPTDSVGSTQLKLTTLPGQVLQGTQQVARLTFIPATNQISAFVPVKIMEASMVTQPEGLDPALLANHNRIVVVGAQPLIEAIRNRSGVRQLILYGKPGAVYTLQSKFAFGPGTANWVNRSVVTMTNTSQTISASSQTQPLMYFRLMQ